MTSSESYGFEDFDLFEDMTIKEYIFVFLVGAVMLIPVAIFWVGSRVISISREIYKSIRDWAYDDDYPED